MGIRYTPWRSDASSEVIGRGEFNHYEYAYEYLLRLHGSTPWVSQSVMCSRHRVCPSPKPLLGRNCGTIIDVLILFLSFLTEASTQCATKELISLPARCALFAVLTLDLHVAASSLLQGHDNDDGATQFASDGLSGAPGAPGNGVHRIRGDAPAAPHSKSWSQLHRQGHWKPRPRDDASAAPAHSALNSCTVKYRDTTLGHFSFAPPPGNATTFRQRFFVCQRHWSERLNWPILFYAGERTREREGGGRERRKEGGRHRAIERKERERGRGRGRRGRHRERDRERQRERETERETERAPLHHHSPPIGNPRCSVPPHALVPRAGNEADVTLYLNNTGLMWKVRARSAHIGTVEPRHIPPRCLPLTGCKQQPALCP